MDYTTRELLKRYQKLALGQPFAPVLLNILVTSVCDTAFSPTNSTTGRARNCR